jgi:uncharacterized membrane protein
VTDNEEPEKPSRNQPAPSNGGKQRLRHVRVTWQGPLPPPAALKAIDEVVPGGASRLIIQVEAESIHRRKMETRKQNYPFYDQMLARLSALIFALACLWLIKYAIDKEAYVQHLSWAAR